MLERPHDVVAGSIEGTRLAEACTMTDADTLARMIKAGTGELPADLVVRDVRLLDVITGAIVPTDVAIVGDRIVGTHGAYRGETEIDGRGRFCVPGFIDTHLHIESSLVTPFEFDRCVLPHGVTTRDLRPARDRQRARGRGHPAISSGA